MQLTFPAGGRRKCQTVGYNTSTICLRSLFVFRPKWTSKETYGKDIAPSRYLEYATQGNFFSGQLYTK